MRIHPLLLALPIFVINVMRLFTPFLAREPDEEPETDKSRSPEEWENYNLMRTQNSAVIRRQADGRIESTLADSYTKDFFDYYKLYPHLNESCKRIVQLGASNGNFMGHYKKLEWDVVGYDYSKTAVSEMTKKGILAKQVDLNLLGADKKKKDSVIRTELRKDFEKTSNIFLFKILELLGPEAFKEFFYLLMDDAAPGSIFFIAGPVEPNTKSKTKTGFTRNYKLSFFARTDMEILRAEDDGQEELLVIRKVARRSPGG
jgi:hypothetical protein